MSSRPGECNSHTKPMSRHFYRPVYFRHFSSLYERPWERIKMAVFLLVKWRRQCLWLVTEFTSRVWYRGKFKLKIDRTVTTPWQEYTVQYTTAALHSDWLYFLWHGIKRYPQLCRYHTCLVWTFESCFIDRSAWFCTRKKRKHRKRYRLFGTSVQRSHVEAYRCQFTHNLMTFTPSDRN